MTIVKGKKVKIQYVGTFDDGSEFDSSEKHGQPLEFEVGEGQVIPGFENAVIGMEAGQEKEVVIKPAEAYGEHNPEFLKKVPRSQLPAEQEPQAGMMLGVGLPNGQQIPAVIAEVSDDDVTLDLNHPLAGKTLHFKIKVVEVN
ncbi:peptidylprolyl isomerase [Candidatus Woesearchaeota archaeon CG10_big_fil_rev_8_21_14_0_10_45_16]|nr:MAG: peptidylprolyl isomerase [Candidatus Woesearchaeota archaeon CG10_big_fil_rev_8_21_14_0_10_45_16]